MNSQKMKIRFIVLVFLIALPIIPLYAKDFNIYGFIPWKSYIKNGETHKDHVQTYLSEFNIKPIRVLYHREFLTDGKPDSTKIKAIAQSTIFDKTPISFDIEIGNRFKPETNLPIILKTLTLYHQYRGQARVGVYGVLPQNTHGGSKLNKQKIEMYKQLNQQYAAVAKLVDFISPSLYNYDKDDLGAWKKAAEFSMIESKKYSSGKPIIPYITATYKVDKFNYAALTESNMDQRLTYLKQLGADGVIVWQSSRERDLNGEFPILRFDQGWGKSLLKH